MALIGTLSSQRDWSASMHASLVLCPNIKKYGPGNHCYSGLNPLVYLLSYWLKRERFYWLKRERDRSYLSQLTRTGTTSSID